MRNATGIQEEIDLIRKEHSDRIIHTTKELKTASDKILFLNHCLRYLKDDPREDFVARQLAITEKRLKRISDNYYVWLINHPKEAGMKNPEATYNRIMETKKIKKQIKTLVYIAA